MSVSLHIIFRNIPHSDPIEAEVRRRAEKLEQFSDRVSHCDVTIETVGKHKQQGRHYAVRIDITLPGKAIATTRHHQHEDVYVALRDAFDASIRQLQDFVQVRRG